MLALNKEKIKKGWLYSLIFTICSEVILDIFNYKNYHTNDQYSKEVYVVKYLIISSLIGYIFYRCAYKKPGTKFLIFFLILIPLSYLFMILQIFYLLLPYSDEINIKSIYSGIPSILIFLSSGVFYYFSLKLYELNMQIKSGLKPISLDSKKIDFTKKEKKIRKLWFTSYLVFFIIYSSLFLMHIPISILHKSYYSSLREFFAFLILIILIYLTGLLFHYLLYKYAYKKMGINLLLLNIFFIVVIAISNLVNIFTTNDKFFLIGLIPIAWFLFVNFQIFMINRKYRKKLASG